MLKERTFKIIDALEFELGVDCRELTIPATQILPYLLRIRATDQLVVNNDFIYI